MKKKELFQSLKVIALALILAVGVSYATGAWEDASGTPPENNAPRPVNVSDEVQTKAGDLYIENSGVGLFGTELLAVFGESSFNDRVNLGDDTDATDENVDIYVSGRIINDDLSQENNPDITYPAHICANVDGSLMPCEGPAPLVWGSYFVCAGSTGCPTAIIGDTTWRPVPFGNNNGENNIFGTDPDTTPGLFWVLEVYYSGAWHNLLAEGAPTSSAGEGCWDWIEESFPAWDGNVTHVRIQQTHDEDWGDPDVSNSTNYVSPGYGDCVYQDQVE
jgi:hypothetical protein